MQKLSTLITQVCPGCSSEAIQLHSMFHSTIHQALNETYQGIDMRLSTSMEVVHYRLDCPNCNQFRSLTQDIPLN